MIGIYKITSPSGKVYIGQSVNIKKRFHHYSNMNNCENQIRLFRSFKKYGTKNHLFEVVEECNVSELNEKERYYQEMHNAIGENGLNCKLTNTKYKKGIVSDEIKAKISNKNKGVVRTENHKQILRTNFLGRKHSEESLKKMRDNNARANLGRIVSLETRKKLSENNSRSNSKLVLNTCTGIFYDSITEASLSTNKNYNHIKRSLNGTLKNNKTDFKLV